MRGNDARHLMDGATKLPDGLLAAWYGDDFTGAAATMEVFAFAGLNAVLFFDIPTAAQLARFPEVRGIGIAGVARSQTPDWMAQNLPRTFDYLAGLNAPLSFYKVCSTFDSAPQVGSIGSAADIAAQHFDASWMPLLVAAPPIGRWQAFGNLFAAGPGGTYRLDQHPVMARHPVTPMDDADLGRHLSHQTDQAIGLVDVDALARDASGALAKARGNGATIVSIDAVDGPSLAAAGKLIWEAREPGQFAIGSQGVLYALIAYWQAAGLMEPAPDPASAGVNDQLVAVSGSVSQVTEAQITWACANGFTGVRLDAAAVVDAAALKAAESAAMEAALNAAASGAAPLIYTAKGPSDPAIARLQNAVETADISLTDARDQIGAALGRILRAVLERTGMRRAIISGGDTSGHAARQLEIFALSALAPTIPAAALCKAHSENPNFDGLELALKGGQMGAPDYFGAIRAGGGSETATP